MTAIVRPREVPVNLSGSGAAYGSSCIEIHWYENHHDSTNLFPDGYLRAIPPRAMFKTEKALTNPVSGELTARLATSIAPYWPERLRLDALLLVTTAAQALDVLWFGALTEAVGGKRDTVTPHE